jgi:DNA-binding NarL/FixJ family response regulator
LEKLRLLVAEDHDAVRGICVTLLQSEFEVVASVGDGEKLMKAAVHLLPDVIVSDILMPAKDGLSVRTELLARKIEIPFVFITLMDVGLVSPLPASVSYVHKSDLTAELIAGVWAVARGEVYLSQSFRELWGSP